MILRELHPAAPLRDPRTSHEDCARRRSSAALVAGLFGVSEKPGQAARAGRGTIVAETRRLILRRHEAADYPAYFTMHADPVMARFAGRVPSGPDEAWARLLRQAGHWSMFGYGFLAIEEKATGCFVGEAGLAHFRRNLGAGFDGLPEAGWAIAPWAQGHGYATEAAAAALSWLEAGFGLRRTVCLVHSGNAPSLRVAEKLGYARKGECEYRGYDAIMFERTAA